MRFRWAGAAVLLLGVLMLGPGPSAGQPPGGMTFQVQPGGTSFQPPPGGFGPPGGGGFGGQPGGGGFQRGGFGGQPGGGGFGGQPGGGFGGGMRTPPDPEAMWNRMSGGQDSINLNDPRNQWLKGMIERGGNPLPPNGILTKQQFADGMQKMAAARQAAQGGQAQPGPGGFGQSPGGGSMSMPFNPNGGPGNWGGDRERRRDFGGGPNGFAQGPGGFPGQGPGGWPGQGPGGPGQGWPGQGGDGSQGPGGPPPPKPDDFSQIAIRYGKLPPGLPDWFTDLDTDKDAQIGLYEWRDGKRKTADFTPMDLDGDGLLAPQEYLRYVVLKAGQDRDAAIEANGVPDPAPRPSRTAGGNGGPGGGRPALGPGGPGGGKGGGKGSDGDNTERRQKGKGKG